MKTEALVLILTLPTSLNEQIMREKARERQDSSLKTPIGSVSGSNLLREPSFSSSQHVCSTVDGNKEVERSGNTGGTNRFSPSHPTRSRCHRAVFWKSCSQARLQTLIFSSTPERVLPVTHTSPRSWKPHRHAGADAGARLSLERLPVLRIKPAALKLKHDFCVPSCCTNLM